jgi:hypothetical protein
MSTIYLGNVLGGTGPTGPMGPTGCPSCTIFPSGDWAREVNSLTISNSADNTYLVSNCWVSGESITLAGVDANLNQISEENTIEDVLPESSQIQTAATLHAYNEDYEITICHGSNIGPTGPAGGPTGPSGPVGPTGPTGPQGADCSGTSTTTINLNSASTSVGAIVTVSTEQGKCWTIGQVIIVNHSIMPGGLDDYLVGKVTEYTGTTLSFSVMKKAGTISTDVWHISVSGDLGHSGPTGPTGPMGPSGPTGPDGPTGPRTLRGSADIDTALSGGAITLSCFSKDAFNCELTASTSIQLEQVSAGQVIYIRVKTSDANASLTWVNPSDGTMYWENDVTPTQTSSVARSTLYKIIKIKHSVNEIIYLGMTLGDYHI